MQKIWKFLLTWNKKTVYIETPNELKVIRSWPVGRMAYAEDCKSFYIGSIPVPASRLFRLSSAVEQSAVNRSVICSNQIVGAKDKAHPWKRMGFLHMRSKLIWTDGRWSSVRSGKLVKTSIELSKSLSDARRTRRCRIYKLKKSVFRREYPIR